MDLGRIHDEGEGLGIGLADDAQRLGNDAPARHGHDDLLVPAGIAAKGGDQRRAAVCEIGQSLRHFLTVFGHGVDDLGVIHALRDRVDHLGADEDRDRGIDRHVKIAEDQRCDRNDRHIHEHQQRPRRHVGQQLFQNQRQQ